MSGVGQVGGHNHEMVTRSKTHIESKNENANSEPKDKIEIGKKDISKTRKVIEKIVGSPVGLVTMAGNAAGGFFSGGVAGVSKDSDATKNTHTLMTGLANVGAGIAGGAMVGGLVGGIIGGVGGFIMCLLSAQSESFGKIGGQVGEAAENAVKNNVPTDLKLRDAVRDGTEGAIIGAVKGGVEGLKEGTTYGAGIVSGVIEGTKGMAGALAGTYEKAEVKEEKETPKESFAKKALKTIASTPRNLLKFVTGTVTGAAGAALGVLDGAIQGTIAGMSENEDASKSAHNIIRGLQIAAAGTVAGLAIGGGVMAAGIGLGVATIAALTAGAIAKRTGTDKEFAQGVTDAVENSKKDNYYEKGNNQYGHQSKNTYETFRDGIEGTMTGIGAGIREGFKESSQIGTGLVDGVFDGAKAVGKGIYRAAKGIAKGIPGGIKGSFEKVETEEKKPSAETPVNESPAEKKKLSEKIIEMPGKVIKGIAGAAIGTISAPLHIIPGAVKGVNSSLTGRSSDRPLHITMFAQNIALGAGGGLMMGGPIGAAIGGGVGLLASGINILVADKGDKYGKLAEKINDRVKKAEEDNKGTNTEKFFQGITEGAIIGATSSVSDGFSIGRKAGEKTVEGAVDVGEGVLRGTVEVAGNIIRGGPREQPESK